MYLKELNWEEKSAFYQLACEVMRADGEIREEELHMLTEYQIEMGVAVKSNFTHEQAIRVVNMAEVSVRKKILFELIGLALADTTVQLEEHELLIQISEELLISKEYYLKAVAQIQEYMDLLFRINEAICGV